MITNQKSPITRYLGPALPAAKPYRDLFRAVLSACTANPIGVRALATCPDVIGVKTGDVRHSGNQHPVTINVYVVRGSPALSVICPGVGVGVGVAVGVGVGVGVALGVGVAVGVGVGVPPGTRKAYTWLSLAM